MDDMLEISGLPHKMTKHLMAEVAFYGQNQSSFQAASQMIEKSMEMEISHETVREVTERLGRELFEEDTQRARQGVENMATFETAARPRKATLYIMTDGATVNTRVEDGDGSTKTRQSMPLGGYG